MRTRFAYPAIALAALAGSAFAPPALAQDKPEAPAPAQAPAQGQVQPEARQKLQDMAAALKSAQSLGFSVALKGTGIMAMLPEMKGDVIMVRSGAVWKMRVEGTRGAATAIDKDSTEVSFTLVTDGQKTTWTDAPSKTVYERSAASAGNAEPVNVTELIIPRELKAPEPFASFVAAPSITLEDPPTSADGVKCDIIAVQLENKDEYRLAIAQSDHLPRRIQKLLAGGGGASQAWSLTSVRTSVSTDDNTWRVATPEGYTFSPMPAPAPAPAATGPIVRPFPKAGGTDAKVRSTGVAVDDLAPDFELKTPAGEAVRLSALRPNVVLLEFWGSWCPPCKIASPEVQKLADRYKDQPVKVYGLSVREPSDEAPVKAMSDQKLTFGLLRKADEVAKTYHVINFPMFFVIGKEGEIVYSTAWKASETPVKLAEAIDAALAGKRLAPPPPPAAQTQIPPPPPAAPAAPAPPASDKPGAPAMRPAGGAPTKKPGDKGGPGPK